MGPEEKSRRRFHAFQCRFVDFRRNMRGAVGFKRTHDTAIVDPIKIFLFYYVVPCVKRGIDPLRVKYANILRQMRRKGLRNAVHRDLGNKIAFPTLGNGGAKSIGMNAAIGTTAPDDVARIPEQCLCGLIEFPLNAVSVRLDLIAAIVRSEIRKRK